MRAALLTNPLVTRIGPLATAVYELVGFMDRINNDGCGVAFAFELLKDARLTCMSATRTLVVCFVLHSVTVALPKLEGDALRLEVQRVNKETRAKNCPLPRVLRECLDSFVPSEKNICVHFC